MNPDFLVTAGKPPASPPRTVATTGVETTLAVIGGQWIVLIFYLLAHRPHRYSEIKHTLTGITGKVLSRQLRHLVRHKIVARRAGVPAKRRVTYRLTPAGESLRPLLKLMCDWGQIQREAALRSARVREAKALALERRGLRDAAAAANRA